ncbi:MAG: hypothetical protein H7839_03780 [Magnetococcus sp. YQC-5]
MAGILWKLTGSRFKAFATIKDTGMYKLSDLFGQITISLWGLLMKGSLNSFEMEKVTPDYLIQFEKEWFDGMMNAMPEEELFSLPKFEHRLLQERQEEAATMLFKLICLKFGPIPDWAAQKVKSANLEMIEIWSENFVFAISLDDVFAT